MKNVDRPLAGPQLSRWKKLIYGLGDWGTSASTTTRNLFWLFFLVSVVGLRAEVAGLVILVGKAWDGINDPLVGMISDRLQTRWGRRRPFLLFGAVPFGLVFFLLFYVPPIANRTVLAVYYGLVFLLFDTIYTLINVPYTALTAELTEDYDERSSLAGWRITISTLAAFVTAAFFKLLAENIFAGWLPASMALEERIRFGYALTAALWGLSLMLPPLLLFKVVREPQRVPPDTDPWQPLKIFREVFQNRPFRLAAVIYLLTFSTVDIILTVFLWFLVFYVRVAPGFDSFVLGLVLAIALVTMPLTVKLTHRFGKRNAYIGSMAFWAVVLFIIAQVPPGGQGYLLAAAVFAGFGFGPANVIPWAIVADVIEEDELRTGKRREGVYAGFLVFFRKLATALAVFGVTTVLSWTGFQGGNTGGLFIEQPPEALLALRFFVGILPAFMLVLAIIAAWRYPLTRDAHEEIRRQLAQRRAV